MTQDLALRGMRGRIWIRRDDWGIPHVTATSDVDAWFGLGYACATDRLWQMEWDRRRAVGRTAELVGVSAVAADKLARRLQLEASARRDIDAMSADARLAFGAYAAGVNEYVNLRHELPPEFGLTAITPEPWEPWHSVATFKIRHAFMSTWPVKMVQAHILAMIGPEKYGVLNSSPPDRSAVVVPPSGATTRLYSEGVDDLRKAGASLSFLTSNEGGSNAWVIHGSKTASGYPILCNDSHRQLDVPNVYWQARVSCPEFDVVGATFAGVPGFPHFGHNGAVAWSITHAMADNQDLYLEEFDPDNPARYRIPGGWGTAAHRIETIKVRGGLPLSIDLWTTRHGPIVHGDPAKGYAIALRYTAIDGPCRTFDVLGPMLLARSVEELQASQRAWVDPVNNFLCADRLGNIGYLTRGVLPVRSSQQHRQFPAPGWTDDNEWIGSVAFEDLPRLVNPVEGFIASANQSILETDEPYIAHSFAEPFRAERIVELLSIASSIDLDYAAAMQGDLASTAARRWVTFLGAQAPLEGRAELGRALLSSWDARLTGDSSAALLYGCFRRAVAQALFEPVTGTRAWDWLTASGLPERQQPIRRWLANIVSELDLGALPPDRVSWREVLQRSLEAAWVTAESLAGADPTLWRWDQAHVLVAKHPLTEVAVAAGKAFDPPAVGVGGDGDTVSCGGYVFGDSHSFAPRSIAVYRQVIDMGDIQSASYVLPGGASGVPGHRHYLDQFEIWARMDRIPMSARDHPGM